MYFILEMLPEPDFVISEREADLLIYNLNDYFAMPISSESNSS